MEKCIPSLSMFLNKNRCRKKVTYAKHHPLCIFGSHNSSNTLEAVMRTNEQAISSLLGFL